MFWSKETLQCFTDFHMDTNQTELKTHNTILYQSSRRRAKILLSTTVPHVYGCCDCWVIAFCANTERSSLFTSDFWYQNDSMRQV